MRKEDIAPAICLMLFGWAIFTYIIPIRVTDGESYTGACQTIQKLSN